MGAVYSNNACVTCNFLNQSVCTSTCPDHIYTVSGSSAAACLPCYNIYGADCIRCTTSICLECSFTSGLVLASDSKSCVIPNCNVSNCIQCYASGAKCYRCGSGFEVLSNFTCGMATCNIAYCKQCSGSTCAICFPGYSVSSDGLDCMPICQDVHCTNCIGPNICGTCATSYSPDANGICQIDCTSISVANCVACTTTTACGRCASGFTSVNGGTLCQATCTTTNCKFCTTNSSVC